MKPKNIDDFLEKEKNNSKYIKILPKHFFKNKNEIKKILKNSHSGVKNLDSFERVKIIIVKSIHRQGSFLDIGCANGLFLKFLQHWSKYKLDLYGIEVKKDLLLEARKMFPKKTSHFEIIQLEKFILNPKKRKDFDFPSKFDFIYWNMWDNWNFALNEHFNIFNEIFKILKKEGRFILEFHGKPGKRYKHINQLEKRGIIFDKKIEEKHRGENTILVWIEKY